MSYPLVFFYFFLYSLFFYYVCKHVFCLILSSPFWTFFWLSESSISTKTTEKWHWQCTKHANICAKKTVSLENKRKKRKERLKTMPLTKQTSLPSFLSISLILNKALAIERKERKNTQKYKEKREQKRCSYFLSLRSNMSEFVCVQWQTQWMMKENGERRGGRRRRKKEGDLIVFHCYFVVVLSFTLTRLIPLFLLSSIMNNYDHKYEKYSQNTKHTRNTNKKK